MTPTATAAYRLRLLTTPTAAGSAVFWTPWLTLGAVGRLGRWLRSSGTAYSPTLFRGTVGPVRTDCTRWDPLSTDLRKIGVLHAFLGRLTSEAASVPGIAELTLLGIDRDGVAHILHSLFSVLVGPYNPDRRLFGSLGRSLLRDSPRSPIYRWFPSGHGALSQPCPGMNTG